jgi:membrane dipeptidase
VHLDEHDPEAQADLKSLLDGGITASFFAAYVPPAYANRGSADFARKLISIIQTEAQRRADAVSFVTDSAGIRKAKRDGKLALMIGVEGGHAIEDSLDILRELYDRGARYMTLTHVNTNNWCDSSGDAEKHGGLTDFGRTVVRTMNDLGMIVDVSHISDKAFSHVIETSRAPVVATHSSCRALCRHPRNMTDDMLRTLARNGGVCMINFFSAFISDDVAEVILRAAKRDKKEKPPDEGGTEELPNDRMDWDAFLKWFESLGSPAATLNQVADHVFHAADIAGIEHVGIGSDFDGVPALPTGLTDASMLPSLTRCLLERGMSEGDVEKVLGGNFMRVFEAVEHASAQS